jgi:hypothetical protein
MGFTVDIALASVPDEIGAVSHAIDVIALPAISSREPGTR